MTHMSLHVNQQVLTEPLTIGTLRDRWPSLQPLWISLEPRAWLLERDGRPLTGRLPGLAPLARRLPDALDDLPLLEASIHWGRQWQHFHDAHPLSKTPGRVVTWSLDAFDGADGVEGLASQRQEVLSWRDRERFGLAPDPELPEKLAVERYLQGGRLIAWRLLSEPSMEAGT